METLMNGGDMYADSAPDARPGANATDQTDEEKQFVDSLMRKFYAYKRYRKRYDHKWLDYYKIVRGAQWDARRPKWKNSEVINFVWQTIQSQIPLQTDVRPRFSFIAKEPNDRAFADILDSLAESDFDSFHWARVVFELIFDGWMYGTSHCHMDYDVEADLGIGAPYFETVDNLHCYPHPDCNDPNDRESDCFFYVKPTATYKVKAAYPKRAQFIKPDGVDKFSKARTELTGLNQNWFNSDKNLAEGSYGVNDQTTLDDIERTLVFHCYMKPVDTEETEETEQGEDGTQKTTYVIKKKWPNGRYVVIANGLVLRDGPLPFDDGLIPYAKYNNYILPREYYGVSETEQLESPQSVFNKILCFSLDCLAMTGNPLWIIDSNSEVDAENLVNTPGSVVVKNPGSEVRREAGVGINPTAFSMLDRLTDWFGQVAGQSEFSSGNAEGGVTAASAIEQLIKASRTRIRQKQRNLDDTMTWAGKMYMNRVLQFYTVPKIFRMTAKDGTQFFRKAEVEQTEDGKPMIVYSDYIDDDKGFTQETSQRSVILQGTLDVTVKTGSELPYDVADNERKALALFDRGIIDSEEVLTRLEYPNKEAILERLAVQAQQAAAQQPA
jgi:hypothetical protein